MLERADGDGQLLDEQAENLQLEPAVAQGVAAQVLMIDRAAERPYLPLAQQR